MFQKHKLLWLYNLTFIVHVWQKHCEIISAVICLSCSITCIFSRVKLLSDFKHLFLPFLLTSLLLSPFSHTLQCTLSLFPVYTILRLMLLLLWSPTESTGRFLPQYINLYHPIYVISSSTLPNMMGLPFKPPILFA